MAVNPRRVLWARAATIGELFTQQVGWKKIDAFFPPLFSLSVRTLTLARRSARSTHSNKRISQKPLMQTESPYVRKQKSNQL